MCCPAFTKLQQNLLLGELHNLSTEDNKTLAVQMFSIQQSLLLLKICDRVPTDSTNTSFW